MKTKPAYRVIPLCIILVFATEAFGKTLCKTANPNCPTVGYVEYIQDDNSTTIYEHEHYCDGTDCWGVYEGREDPCKIVVLPVTPHFDFSIPTNTLPYNTITGRYIVDAENDTFRMRTPIDQNERDAIIAMWEAEFGSPSIAMQSVPETVSEKIWARRRAQEPINRMRIEANKATAPNIDALKQVLALYTERNKPEGSQNKEYATRVANLLQKVGVKGKESNMSIIQQPSQLNGFTVAIEPVDPSLFSQVQIYDASCQMVWEGAIRGRTDVSLNHLPSGTYFVQGVGKALPIIISR